MKLKMYRQLLQNSTVLFSEHNQGLFGVVSVEEGKFKEQWTQSVYIMVRHWPFTKLKPGGRH